MAKSSPRVPHRSRTLIHTLTSRISPGEPADFLNLTCPCVQWMDDEFMRLDMSEDRAIAEVTARLAAHFPSRDSVDVVIAVRRALSRFDSCSVRDFVPLLVERRVRTEFSAQT